MLSELHNKEQNIDEYIYKIDGGNFVGMMHYFFIF